MIPATQAAAHAATRKPRASGDDPILGGDDQKMTW